MRAERSLDNIDIPHRFVASGVYELPFGAGRRFGGKLPGPVNAAFGGWSVGSIVTRASGRPYNVINSGNPANTGTFNIVSRPNLISNPYSGFTRSVAQDFNTASFVATPAFTMGSEGRNSLWTRRLLNLD